MSAVFNAAVSGGDSGGATGVERSVRLRAAASAYLSRTLGTATNRRIWTLSMWIKRGSLGSTQCVFCAPSSGSTALRFNSNDTLYFTGASATHYEFTTTQVFRDPTAHLHIVIRFDSTDATAGNRIRIYLNGTQITAFTTSTQPAQNLDGEINNAILHYIAQANSGSYFDGYLTEVYFIDGQALTPSSFGQLDSNNIWVPKDYTGTYGNNGFYLNFRDASAATAAAIGKDSSGNGNNWTPNNISVTAGVTYDSMYDYPVNGASGTQPVGNYATWNPLDASLPAAPAEGNLYVYGLTSAHKVRSTHAFDIVSDNRYFEWTCSSSPQTVIGIMPIADAITVQTGIRGYYQDGTKFNGSTWSAYGTSFNTLDVIGVKAGGGSIEFFKNGVSQGVAFSGLTGIYAFVFASQGTATSGGWANFGQRPFAYTPPTGFKALCTANLPSDAVVTSGSFAGNASADGPVVYLKGNPTALTINGNAVTFGTHADKLATGFKLRTNSASYNASGSNTFTATAGDKFANNNRAQGNP